MTNQWEQTEDILFGINFMRWPKHKEAQFYHSSATTAPFPQRVPLPSVSRLVTDLPRPPPDSLSNFSVFPLETRPNISEVAVRFEFCSFPLLFLDRQVFGPAKFLSDLRCRRRQFLADKTILGRFAGTAQTHFSRRTIDKADCKIHKRTKWSRMERDNTGRTKHDDNLSMLSKETRDWNGDNVFILSLKHYRVLFLLNNYGN